MNIRSKTISLKELTKDFTREQWAIVDLLESKKEWLNNRPTLSKIESGVTNTTIEILSKLATALDIKLKTP